jgi:hypothetical protein
MDQVPRKIDAKTPKRLGRLSMDGLDLEEALRGAMEVEPPSKADDDPEADSEPEQPQDEAKKD